MADKPGILETANNIYFEEVENEDGMQLNLEEQLRTNLAGIIESRFVDSELARDSDENRWITAYHNFRGIYPKIYSFAKTKKAESSLRLLRLRSWQLMVSLLMLYLEPESFNWSCRNFNS